MANWEHLTEILPKSYRNLTTSCPASPILASLCSITSRKPSKRQPGQHLRACRIEASNLLPMHILTIMQLGIKCSRESYREGDGIQDSLALGKYGAARNCGRTRNGCHTACAHQCRRANRLQSSDLFASDRTGAMLTQPQRAGAGPRPQQHHGIRREL